MKKYALGFLILLLLLSGCTENTENPKPDDTEVKDVVSGSKGNYSILTPFSNSPLRQEYAPYIRETDMIEAGRQLMEMSKEYFSVDNYYLSEGAVIDVSRYNELLSYESDNRPYGLNPRRPYSITLEDATVLKDPRFVSDIIELNFHRSTDQSSIDGIAIGLILKRVQVLDENVGTTYRLSDDDLRKIGEALGIRLQSYLRSIDGMVDTPLFIGLYVQESDVDPLPGRYLPGYYISKSFSSAKTAEFENLQEKWIFLNSDEASNSVPQYASDFTLFKNAIVGFVEDEGVGVIGKALVSDGNAREVSFQITTGAKTYFELYALAQYITQNQHFLKFDTKITVDIRISTTTQFVITKQPGQDPVIHTLP